MEKIKKTKEIKEVELVEYDVFDIEQLKEMISEGEKLGATKVSFEEFGTYSCGDYEIDGITMTFYKEELETDEEFEIRKEKIEKEEFRKKQERIKKQREARRKTAEEAIKEKKLLKELMKKYPNVK